MWIPTGTVFLKKTAGPSAKVTGHAARKHGKLWLVGVGPGDPRHLTLYAVETIKKADLILTRAEDAAIVKQYITGKKVEGPERWELLWNEDGVPWARRLPELNVDERRSKLDSKHRERDAYADELKSIMATGRHVVILDGGDPTVFSLFFFWVLEALPPDQVEIIPGIGAINAAFAALKICGISTGVRFVMQTEPKMFLGERLFTGPDDALPTILADHPGTIVFYMAADDIPRLTEKLKKYYPKDMPAAVVYNAGNVKKERICKGTLDTIASVTANEEEKWLGLFVLGRCLDGPVIWMPDS
jgi:uroporphyrin-III C-methyltransferase